MDFELGRSTECQAPAELEQRASVIATFAQERELELEPATKSKSNLNFVFEF